MRWTWIDRFTAFEPGRSATAVKCLSLAEDHFADHFPGFPVMPAPLILEGLAQTGGILVGEANQYRENVVLAKMSAKFHREAMAGEQLRYTTRIVDLSESGARVSGEVHSGPDLIAGSLDFFCVSSAYALDLISRHEEGPRPRRLSHSMRALLRQALGFAAGGRELPAIAAYAAAGTGPGMSLLLARADQEFARSPEDYLALIQEEIEISRDSLLTAAAQVLESRLRGTADPAWWRVVGSQLHMTANRLDLMNVEELYLGQILRRALERAATPPAALPVSPGSGDNGLAALAASSLAWLAASTRDEDLAYAGIPERANDER